MKSAEYLYRPQHKNPDELINDFVVRNAIYERILDNVISEEFDEPSQHILIEGKRGMGKTTLMLRLTYELQKNEVLRQKFVPCKFNEEEYGVANLAILWERIAEYLEEDERFEGLLDLFDDIEGAYGEEQFIQEIIKWLQDKDVIAVVFIDNFFQILEKFESQEQQRLREVLIECNHIKIVAGSARFMERDVGDYAAPFFEFFKREKLNKLDERETRELLIHLAKKHQAKNVIDTIENEPQRIHNVRILCGGVPRTLITFFEVLMDDTNGESIDDLKMVMDRTNELYLQRMNSLSKKEQPIIHAMALHWEAISTGELAKKVGEKSGALSSILAKLAKQQIIEKVETDTKNHLWRIEERFFNIWYLLTQAPKRYQRRVRWLSAFIEALYCEDDFKKRLESHLAYLGSNKLNPEYALLLSNALINVGYITLEQRSRVVSQLKSKAQSAFRSERLPLENEELKERVYSLILKNKFKSARDVLQEYPASHRAAFKILIETFKKARVILDVSDVDSRELCESTVVNGGVLLMLTFIEENDHSEEILGKFVERIKASSETELVLALQYLLLTSDFSIESVSLFLRVLKIGVVKDMVSVLMKLMEINSDQAFFLLLLFETCLDWGNNSTFDRLMSVYDEFSLNPKVIQKYFYFGTSGIVPILIRNDRTVEAHGLVKEILKDSTITKTLRTSIFLTMLVCGQETFVRKEFAKPEVKRDDPSFSYFLTMYGYEKGRKEIIPPEMEEPLIKMKYELNELKKKLDPLLKFEREV